MRKGMDPVENGTFHGGERAEGMFGADGTVFCRILVYPEMQTPHSKSDLLQLVARG